MSLRVLGISAILIFFLQSCKKDADLCRYLGEADDILFKTRLIAIDAEGIPECRLSLNFSELDLDSSTIAKLDYKWKINDQFSFEDNIVIKDKGEEKGFVQIINRDDDCFIYKAIDEDFDFSAVCDYLGNEDFFEITQTLLGCLGDNKTKQIQAKVNYKGPSTRGLEYEWKIEGETYSGHSIGILGQTIMKGQLKATNTEDGCFVIKEIEIDATVDGGIVGNRVWEDTGNALGLEDVFDSGDKGLKDVRVDLLSHPSLELIARSITDESGEYHFFDLPSGNYVIKVEKPAGMDFVQQYVGLDTSEDSNVDEFGFTAPFFLDKCEVNLTIDAGLKF